VSADPLTDLEADDRARLEIVLVEFDLAWAPDRLAAAAAELPPTGPFRVAALREMAKIDIERLGRAGRPVSPQDYLDRFPELVDAGTTPDDLLQAAAAARETLPFAPRPDPGGLPDPFGRYRIIRPLGRGGMGSVYLARDTKLDRLVALKVPHFRPGDSEGMERFAREARAAATIDHPNVCRVYDVGRIDEVPYITMAYVEGPTLADTLESGPLPPRRAVELAASVARAIAVAHDHGIVHRDLKPSNILVARDGSPIVTDFGLASRDSPTDPRLTTEGTIIGTPLYMSPEQVAGDRVGPASDVYSLGIVLYEVLTGRPPFGGSRAEVLTQVLTTDPAPPSAVRPEIDPRLDQITQTALAKNPADRFPDMAAFAAALDGWRRARSRRVRFAARAAVLAGVCLLLILGTAGVVQLYHVGRPDTPGITGNGASTTTSSTTHSGTATGSVKEAPPKVSGKPKLLAETSMTNPDRQVVAVSFAPDGRRVYTGTMERAYLHVRRWDGATGSEEPRTKENGELEKWLVFAADGGRYLCGGGLKYVKLRRTESEPDEKELARFETGPHALAGAMSADGRRVIVGLNTLSGGRSVRVYDADSGDQLAEYRGHREDPRCVALADDGRWAFSASPDHHATWEVSAKTDRPRLARGKNSIRCATFIPKSGRVVFGYATGTVSVFDADGTSDMESFPDPPRDAVTCLAVSPNGRLVVAGVKDKSLRAWDVGTRRLQWEVDGLTEEPVAAAFSSDGARLVMAGARWWAVWDLPD